MASGRAVGAAGDLIRSIPRPFRQFPSVTMLVSQHRSARYRPYESAGNYSASAVAEGDAMWLEFVGTCVATPGSASLMRRTGGSARGQRSLAYRPYSRTAAPPGK